MMLDIVSDAIGTFLILILDHTAQFYILQLHLVFCLFVLVQLYLKLFQFGVRCPKVTNFLRIIHLFYLVTRWEILSCIHTHSRLHLLSIVFILEWSSLS